MLYDNSQLARVYPHAWQVTGNEFFRTIVEETLDYVAREMLDPEGVQMLRTQHLPSSSSSAGTAGFYSTQDADSEGEEGKFFVWTPDEIREILRDDAEDFMAAYSVTQHGNWEGRNILEFVGDIDQRPALAEARHKLFHAREKRVHPGRDDVQLAQMQPIMSQYPLGFGQWLQALACALSKPREIAIVGDPEASHTQVLLNIVRDGYQPFQVVALGAPHPDESTVPLLRDRGPVDEQPAAYVCRGFVCRVPVTSPLDLEELLNVR